MNLPEISIKRPVFATVLLLVLIVLGIMGYQKMKIEEMPDMASPYVMVNITYDGAQPEQVDSQVVQKVEDALAEVKGIKHIESISSEGYATINVEFNFGVDPNQAAQDVRDKVNSVRDDLPTGVKEPVIAKYDLNAAPVMALAITSEKASIRELSIFTKDVLNLRLQKVLGVGKIRIVGQEEREIQLLLNLEPLNGTGLSLTGVTERLQWANQDIPAGKLGQESGQLSLRSNNKFTSVDQFYDVTVGERSGVAIPYWQIGTVKDGIKERTDLARYDGKPAIVIEVGRQSGANTIDVAKGVKAELESMKESLPEGVEIHMVRDDSERIVESIEDVWFDLTVGGFFAVMLVWWFLGDWRSTIISAIAIPASIVSAFFFMKLMGFSINTISLLSMSLSVGLLIDDAIVVIENIIRHRELGADSFTAALEGAKEITLAVLATTFTVVAVFLPVGMVDGADGELYKQFGITIVFAVLVSLFISFTLTPMMAARYLPVGEASMPRQLKPLWNRWNHWFDRTTKLYGKTLDVILRTRRKTVLLTAVGLFVASLGLMQLMGSSFIPSTDQSQFTVTVQNLPGASVQVSDERAKQLTDVVKALPEVSHVYATATSENQQLYIRLVPKKERVKSQSEVAGDVRAAINAIPGMRADIREGEGKPVAISVTGPNVHTLQGVSRDVANTMETIPGVRDVLRSGGVIVSGMTVKVDDKKADDLGISSAIVGNTLQAMFYGNVVGKYRDGDELNDVRLKLDKDARENTNSLQSVYVASSKLTADGKTQMLPLSQISSWNYSQEPSEIRRYDRQKEVRITANLEKTDLGKFGEIFTDRTKAMQLPAGYQIRQTGTATDMDNAFGNMGTALVVGILFIFMVMAAQFESWSEPIAIMPALPLAAIGAILFLFLGNYDISLISLIGIMMLMGLVTKNAILLIDFAKQQIGKGHSVHDALIEAGQVRLRPILMTSLAMIFGMIPIMLGLGPGAETRAPMAFAIVGGVLTSTMLTLFVVPVCYTFIKGEK